MTRHKLLSAIAIGTGIAVVATSLLTLLVLPRAEAQPGPESHDSATLRLNEAALRLERAYQLVEEHPVPIGCVIAYWGTLEEIAAMDNYELCDGGIVEREDSPLFGKPKPPMSGLFIRGMTGEHDVFNRPRLGGSNTIDLAALSTRPHALTVEEMPEHRHPHSHHMFRHQAHGEGHRFYEREVEADSYVAVRGEAGRDSKYDMVGADDGGWMGQTRSNYRDEGGGEGHNHGLPETQIDNRPAFIGMYYIIRVR